MRIEVPEVCLLAFSELRPGHVAFAPLPRGFQVLVAAPHAA